MTHRDKSAAAAAEARHQRTCTVCGQVGLTTQPRAELAAARACDDCARVIESRRTQQLAAARLADGRTRAEAAAAWLSRDTNTT